MGPELTLQGIAKLRESVDIFLSVQLTAAKLEAWKGRAFKTVVRGADQAVLPVAVPPPVSQSFGKRSQEQDGADRRKAKNQSADIE